MGARTLFVALGLSMVSCSMAAGDVVREGSGPRRDALNAMELKPFPVEAWSGLADWTGGEALTGATMNAKAVLICTWASWYPVSIAQGLKVAQDMEAKYGGQGLMVVGVHHAEGWAEAAGVARDKGVTFVIARDVGGAFRAALKVDQDPDFYVIDRAGNLRFADITTGSVDEACSIVVRETAAQAADQPRLAREREEQARAEALRQQGIRSNIELDTLPAVPPGFSAPDEGAYLSARWPRLSEEDAKKVGLMDQNGKAIRTQIAVNPSGWQPKAPVFEGRAVVVYLWNPELRESYAAFDAMDRLQQKYVRDLVVVGAYTPMRLIRNNSGFGGGALDEDAQSALRLESFVKSRSFKHTLAADLGGSVVNSLPQAARQQMPVPLGVIASSDGVIRYIGVATDPNFEAVAASVLSVDPGVRSRQAADQRFIENKRK
jgi:hypothetical protein